MNQRTNSRILHFAGRIACAALAPALAGLAVAGAQDVAEHWTYPTVVSGGLPSELVLGNQDSVVFSTYGGSEGRTVLIDSDNSDPANPRWLEVADEAPDRQIADAASQADVYATLTVEPDSASTTGMRAVVRKYSDASQGQPDWTRELPIDVFFDNSTAIGVSADGQRIVAVACTLDIETHAFVFGADSSVWQDWHVIDLSPFTAARVSGDAKWLYLHRGSRVRMVDLVQGTLAFTQSQSGEIFTGAHAISEDGGVIAYALSDRVVVQQRNWTGSWPQVATYPIDPQAEFCSELALSADGGVLAAGIENFDGVTASLEVLDLATGALRLDHDFEGAGSYTNSVGAIDLTADGSVAAIALWGDQNGSFPEVSVYSTTAGVSSAPTHTLDLPGSALSLDLSGDGAQLVVGSKTIHMNNAGLPRGQIDRLVLTAPQDDGGDGGEDPEADFSMEGEGTIGEIVTFHFTPPAESEGRAFLLVSQDPAPAPMLLGDVGTLHLRRAGLLVYPYHHFVSGSSVEMQYAMPFDPQMVGSTFYFQGFCHAPRRLSTDWVEVTVAP